MGHHVRCAASPHTCGLPAWSSSTAATHAGSPPPTTNRQGSGTNTSAIKLATLRALRDRIKELEAELSSEFLSTLDEGDVKAATLDDGTRLGKISKARGRLTPAVTNETAFLDWVRENHPSEIVEAVRPAYQAKVFASAKVNGLPVDPATGEVIPGVEPREGQPFISFRGEPGYQQVIAQRWSELVGPALLEAGDE